MQLFAPSGGIAPPVNTVAPAVSGTPAPGQTLTTTNGTWTGSPTSYTYQWKRDGSSIGGATNSTYVLTASENGTTVTCVVTATNAGGSASATSNGIAVSGLHTSLISYWQLGEASGNRVDSVTASANDLAPTNTPGNVTGKQGNAIQLVSASGQFLSITSNASLQTGDIDFTIACWVYMDSSKDQAFMGKWKSGSDEYLLSYRPGTGRFILFYSSNGTATASLSANTFGAPSLSTWYFLVAWHDSVNDQVGISVNGTADTASYSSGLTALGEPFRIGRQGDTTAWDVNGRVDEAGFWKRVLSSGERATLYNSGNGVTYPFA